MNPKVSVCMPNYNYAGYLPEAIESVLKQTHTDFEFIIIDDCSTDNSVEIIKEYAKKDRRITLKVNERNLGQAKSLNLCLAHATGKYIKFVFSDDVLVSEEALRTMVSVLDSDDEVALVATARYLIDDKSTILRTLSDHLGKVKCRGIDIIKDCLIEQKNKIGEPTVVLFRKKHAERGFDEKYNQNVDMEMWFHILEQGKFAYIDEPLCSFRTHPSQQTKINLKRVDLCVESFQLLQSYANKPYVHLSPVQREYMYYVPVYSIWKLYKKGKVSHQTAFDEIKKHSSIYKFFLLLPLYRFYRFVKRLDKQLFQKT